jgi:Spy/CpxP family protein refolding chaperone
LLAELDLTPAQKERLKALTHQYARRLPELLSTSDPATLRQRVQDLLDEGWNQAALILTPEQQARVERFLQTRRAEIEAGLRGVWLQGI